MVKSTAVAHAGLSKQTLYEVERQRFTRGTYDRAIVALDHAKGEVETLIKAAWGTIMRKISFDLDTSDIPPPQRVRPLLNAPGAALGLISESFSGIDRIDPALNMHRYYVLSLEPTLFGDAALVREWCRIGAPRGRRLSQLHESEGAAREAGGLAPAKNEAQLPLGGSASRTNLLPERQSSVTLVSFSDPPRQERCPCHSHRQLAPGNWNFGIECQTTMTLHHA